MRPYPFDRWPKLSRDDLPRITRWARALPVRAQPDAKQELESWLGVSAAVQSRPIYTCAPGGLRSALSEPLAAVILRSDAGTLAVELSPRLATAVVDRILGGEGTATPTVLSNVERGALAYAAARFVDPEWKVVTVVTTAEAMVHALGDDGSVVRGWDVQAGETKGVLRVWIPHALQIAAPARALVLPDVQLDIALDAGTSRVAGNELAKLELGDIVVLDEVWWPERVAGHVVSSMRTRWWCDGVARCESIETGLDESPQEGTRVMQDEGVTETMKRIGDAPVFVAVELARFRMSVEELAKVRPGEVLGTGTKIGQSVALRVGDKIVARGELVDVEGEVGVQITELST